MTASRRLIILALKLAVAAVLVGWLVRSGTLDFAVLRAFVDRPGLLVLDLAVFTLAVGLGAVRWRLLLGLAGIRIPVGRAFQLQLVAMFFNVVLPGNIGGDVVKSVYVARDVEPAHRPAVFLIALVDRLVAVAGLVVVAVISTLARGDAAWTEPASRRLAITVLVIAGVGLVATIVVAVVVRRFGDRAERRIGDASAVRVVLGRLIAAARMVAAGPGQLAAALGLAIAAHAAGTVLFTVLAAAAVPSGAELPLATVASVYPPGMLTLIVPISYAGIGVGHVAFNQLFALVDLTGGATAFNLYLIGQTAPCLVGLVPYLALRRRAALPTDAEAVAQQAGADRADKTDYSEPR